MDKSIFEPFQLGPLALKNRFVMASLTRVRADPETGNPNDLNVEYYTQRARSAALILSEAAYLTKDQNSFRGAGGFENEDNAAHWKRVTDAVHKEGCFFIAQLCHPGRSLHSAMTGSQPLAPSAIAISGQTHVNGQKVNHEVPKEATIEEINTILDQFENAAKIAKLAGCDGIELHAANGYLVDSFLKTSSNKRTDHYGGSVENRSRLCLQVIDRFLKVFPSDRVGIKLSPVGRYQDMKDDDPISLYKYLLAELEKRNLLYVQLGEAEPRSYYPVDNGADQIANVAATFRPFYKGTLITVGFREPVEGDRRIKFKEADLIAFGTYFISNPDLVERVKNGWPIQKADPSLYYGNSAKGYTDYPTYSANVIA